MFREIRKVKRVCNEQECLEILKNNNYGILSIQGEDGYPYGVPINYIYADGTILLHSSSKGYKIECIQKNPKVCFTVVGKSDILKEEYSTDYESVVIFGEAQLLQSDEERYEAIFKFTEVLAGNADNQCIVATKMGQNPALAMIRVTIEHMTGKHRVK